MGNEEIIKRFKPHRDNLLKILHYIQDNHPQHYLPTEDLEWVARYLNLTKADVYGVVKYYTMFSIKPRGRYIIHVCESPVCKLKESVTILSVLKNQLGVEPGQTTPDGLFTLELSQCLGQCDRAPAMTINGDVYGPLSVSTVREIIQEKKDAR